MSMLLPSRLGIQDTTNHAGMLEQYCRKLENSLLCCFGTTQIHLQSKHCHQSEHLRCHQNRGRKKCDLCLQPILPHSPHFMSTSQTAHKQGIDHADFIIQALAAQHSGKPPPSIFQS